MSIEIDNLMLSMLILNWTVYPIWTTEFAELSLKKSPCKSLLKSARIKQTIQAGQIPSSLEKDSLGGADAILKIRQWLLGVFFLFVCLF